jgi:hypothetical protein
MVETGAGNSFVGGSVGVVEGSLTTVGVAVTAAISGVRVSPGSRVIITVGKADAVAVGVTSATTEVKVA